MVIKAYPITDGTAGVLDTLEALSVRALFFKGSRFKVGSVTRGKFSAMRNPAFHRKFFAMLDVGFDAWEPPESEHRGLPVQKNRERFRKDCIIAAGFYEPVANINGDVRAEAKSISFARMDDEEFERVYPVIVGERWSKAKCDEVEQQVVLETQRALRQCVTTAVPQSVFDALTSHAHNLGWPRTCGSESVRAINAGELERGCDLLAYKPDGSPNWSNVGTRFIQGLHNRRKAERELCLTDLR